MNWLDVLVIAYVVHVAWRVITLGKCLRDDCSPIVVRARELCAISPVLCSFVFTLIILVLPVIDPPVYLWRLLRKGPQ